MKREPGGATTFELNVAVTDRAAVIVTVQVVAEPEQPPPDHPANADPEAGLSVSVTLLPRAGLDVHDPGHEMPAPLTLPEPVPTTETLSGRVALKVAVTDWAVIMLTEQVVAVPEQPPPDQPAKVEPAAGVAVSVT